jgi:hypothetical protein
MKIVRIFGDETFEERRDDVVFADAVNELRVEILHLLAVAFVQDMFTIAFLDVRFRAVAGGKSEQRDCTKSVAPEFRGARGVTPWAGAVCTGDLCAVKPND